MTHTLAKSRPQEISIEQALVQGDLSGLDSEQRVNFYLKLCASLQLNALTKPFEYLRLNGKLVLYARKDATDQLRKIHGVSITSLDHKQLDTLYIVTATAQDKDGRKDSEIGVVSVEGLKGEALSNAMMRASTKAKRRVTLSLCGLGMTDESEVESIPGAYYPESNQDDVAVPAPPAEIVRGAEHRVWIRWMQLVQKARDLGLEPKVLRLPIALDELKDRGNELVEMINEREAELTADAEAVEM